MHADTGKFDPKRTMDGLSPAEVDRRARRSPEPGEPHPVYRRRRYLKQGGEKDMAEWSEAGYRANISRDRSNPHRRAALEAAGATDNDLPASEGGQQTHPYREWKDARGNGIRDPQPNPPPGPPGDPPKGARGLREVETRPDGVRGNDVIEHKHLTGNETTLHDSPQLRAQRAMAEQRDGNHEILLSSDRPLKDGFPQVKPSSTVGSQSQVKYYDADSGKISHVWRDGAWRTVENSA